MHTIAYFVHLRYTLGMFIGIDTFGCDHGRSGVGSYLLSLVKALPLSDSVQFGLFGGEVDRYTYTSPNQFAFERVDVPDSLPAERLWHIMSANKFAARQGYDVVLYAAGSRMLPRSFKKVPGVAVVIDLISSKVNADSDFWQRKRMVRSLSKAQCIIAASMFIKKDLERSGVKSSRIEVVHNGIDHSLFFPKAMGEDEVLDIKPFAIKRPYFIYASRLLGPEKKHTELIQAFSLFKQKTGLPHRLVLAGSDGPYAEEVHKAALESPFASDIFITGYFPHESFPLLYRGAEACLFPSVSEGVGLPVLEAMATDLPVACAKAGALPEIAGEHALYFDSDNTEEMALCMERLVSDANLRQKLVAGGIEWAARFSWEKTAQETLAVLQSVAKK